MRRRFSSRSFSLGCASLAAAFVVSCNYVTDTTLPDEFLLGPPVQLEIRPATLSVIAGDYFSLEAIALDAKGHRVHSIVQWTSSDPSIATVGRFDGLVTGIAVGQATIAASDGASLQATAVVTVTPPKPAASLHIEPAELFLAVSTSSRLNATAYDSNGRLTPATVEWSSQHPGIATVDRVTGVVTAIAIGMTEVTATVGYVNASIIVRVEPPEFLMQWASSATASSQYDTDLWSASQATGAPNVSSCFEESNSWASADGNTQDWLELTYDVPVRPSDIRIHEVWAPGSIVKVEVKDLTGTYHTVYEAVPKAAGGACLLRTLHIPVTNVPELINVIRVSIDQRVIGDWNEIDAVRLIGYR